VHPPHDIGISSSAYSELLLPAALERIAAVAPSAEIRSFGLHTLLSRRNRRAAFTPAHLARTTWTRFALVGAR